MDFKQEYQSIKNVVKDDLNSLEFDIKTLFDNKNPLEKEISDFLTNSPKRLRPLLGYLFLRCALGDINNEQKDVLLAVELIHNATLIHDDVIDESDKRRNEETINKKFDDKLAVVAGDFLLSVAMEKVISTNSIDILQVFASALKSTCLGEINQYFSKFEITTIGQYIEKSKKKTALLFQIALLGGVLAGKNGADEAIKHAAVELAQNFGIAFQIRDDLINVLHADKFSNNDVSLGIYTAPVIFAYGENKDILKRENLLEIIKDSRGIEKTKDLMDNYFARAANALNIFEDSIYKQNILKLINLLKNCT